MFGLDMKSQFLAVCNKNRDIFELREYLKNYLQTMEDHPMKSFDDLPSEVMQVLTDQIIVINFKNHCYQFQGRLQQSENESFAI